MSSLYYHIPFCRQACHYCNFHFATSLLHKNEMTAAMLREIEMQKDYLGRDRIDTIYFGGGTPSLLEPEEIISFLEKSRTVFEISENAEVTLEANPDDITEEKLSSWKKAGINRLSIGIQSFFEEDLVWMNRAHTAVQADTSLQLAKRYFDNITIDLIYGLPNLTDEKWKSNVDKVITLGIPHISCYALTVEPKTRLEKLIRQKKISDVDPGKQSHQFLLLMNWLGAAGYEHYEISNFARPGYRSRHNSSYWSSVRYLGIGPSAHSFNGRNRQWNISNNTIYIRSIQDGILPAEIETLTETQRSNEYIMTALRTSEGISLLKTGEKEGKRILDVSEKYIERGLLQQIGDTLVLTREGKLFADGIAADLFQ